jgi:hypothetical protein
MRLRCEIYAIQTQTAALSSAHFIAVNARTAKQPHIERPAGKQHLVKR